MRGFSLGRRQGDSSLPSPWELAKQAVRLYRANFWQLAILISIVAVPVSLISTYVVDPQADSTLSAYITFVQLAMNLAVMFFVVRRLGGQEVGVREAYYASSVVIVRFVLLFAVLLVLSLSLWGGLLILSAALAPGVMLGGGELALLGLAAIIVALPSIYALVRSWWAQYVLFEDARGPLEAVKLSWQMTRRRTVASFGRLVALLLVLLVLMAVPIAICIGLWQVTGSTLPLVLLSIISSLVVIPVSHFYLYRYHQALKG